MLPAKSSAVVLAAAVVARIELLWQAGRQEAGWDGWWRGNEGRWKGGGLERRECWWVGRVGG